MEGGLDLISGVYYSHRGGDYLHFRQLQTWRVSGWVKKTDHFWQRSLMDDPLLVLN